MLYKIRANPRIVRFITYRPVKWSNHRRNNSNQHEIIKKQNHNNAQDCTLTQLCGTYLLQHLFNSASLARLKQMPKSSLKGNIIPINSEIHVRMALKFDLQQWTRQSTTAHLFLNLIHTIIPFLIVLRAHCIPISHHGTSRQSPVASRTGTSRGTPASNKRATVASDFPSTKAWILRTFDASTNVVCVQVRRIQRPWHKPFAEMPCLEFLPSAVMHRLYMLPRTCRSGNHRNSIFQPSSWTIFLNTASSYRRTTNIPQADRMPTFMPVHPFNFSLLL